MDIYQNKNITGNFKVVLLGIISLICLTINWVLINKALYTDQDLIFWVWPAIAMAVSIALLTLFSAVNNNRVYAISLACLSVLTYILILPKDVFVMLGGAIFLVLLYWFEQQVRAEEKTRQDFSIRRVAQASINLIIYGFLLLLGLNIYYNTSADFKANPDSFYEALGRSAAKSTRYLNSGNDNTIDLNQTIDEYLETETRKKVPNYDTIPENFRQQYLEETKEQFFEQFDINIPTNQPISEVVATFAVERVRASAERFKSFFPLIFTVIILALLRTFSFILKWVALLLTWLFFKFLLMIKFLRIEKVTVEVEKLSI